MKQKRVIIAAGGTGGHFYPGFAAAVEFRRRGWQPLFLVKKDDICRPALEEADLPYAELDMAALPRTLNPLKHLAFAARLVRALALARRIVTDFRPDAVLGTGSYIGFPALLAGRLGGAATYIHESNAVFGLGNRLAGLFCTRAALGLPVRANPLAGRSVLTGTPLRAEFSARPDAAAARAGLGLEQGRLTVLAFGGSQGARRLNEALVKSAAALGGKLQFIHLTGRKNFQEVTAAYDAAGLAGAPWLKVFDYREDMPRLYAAADVVIARSGAGTIAELCAVRRPAVLVPLPSAAGGHQKENALVLAEKGAAVCVEETPELHLRLTGELAAFAGDGGRAAKMAAALAGAGLPDPFKAAAALCDLIEKGGD